MFQKPRPGPSLILGPFWPGLSPELPVGGLGVGLEFPEEGRWGVNSVARAGLPPTPRVLGVAGGKTWVPSQTEGLAQVFFHEKKPRHDQWV